MTTEQWELLLQTIHAKNNILPVGLVVDSPWIPGYCRISTIDFFTQPETWLNSYQKIKKDFPGIMFFPDWWVEYGMAAEPSGFGGKIDFFDNTPPTIHHIIQGVDDEAGIDALTVPDPKKSGLMPFVLHLQKYLAPRIAGLGEAVKIVSSRGPLTIASHLMGVSEFLLCMKINPDAVHKMLKKTTSLCKRWLEAQMDNIKTAEGIFVLDDISGFLGKDDYLEFAHPYFKEIYTNFSDCIKLMHNDTDNDVCYPHLKDLHLDIFNPSYKQPIEHIRTLIGDEITILGSINPSLLSDGTEESVALEAEGMIKAYSEANNGDTKRLIVSCGGGTPMGATKKNIAALSKVTTNMRI